MDKKTPPLRRKRIKKREKPLVLVLYISFWVIIVVMFVGFFISQAGEYNELNAELTRLNLDVERARNQVESLQTQYAMFDSDLYIERLARNRGMVRPGEMVFRNIAD